MPTSNLTYFLIGGGIGVLSAVIGATVDYLLARRRKEERNATRTPGCMLIVAGGLGVTGVIFTIVSWLLTDSIRMAVVTGLGVFCGFFIGFAVLFIGAVLLAEAGR